eukprot:TRINITY_DN13904_c0_g1_i1.p1 TRINITY_DN13904_c0_g1~~TRINITY_DN13904_c0_g1_i1.p1  ORF type:complete len:284 (+),score=41.44 TRINITY_DN13904_c0_g1_i1:99-854(+)
MSHDPVLPSGLVDYDHLDRPVRVYADGIFDLFHFGHARALEQAKKVFPNTYLLVGVCGDEITHRLKGKTVMTDKERCECVRHCKWADEVVEDAPWFITQEFIDKHQIDVVVHGEDACLDEHGRDVYQFVKDQGKYRTIKRTEGVSTSDLIMRVVRDYDDYISRNLARGYNRDQLNLSLVRETAITARAKLRTLRSTANLKIKKLNASAKKNIMDLNDKAHVFGRRLASKLPWFRPHRDGGETTASEAEDNV